MSRIGRKPVTYPAEVSVSLAGQVLKVKGPVGELTLDIHPNIAVESNEADRQLQVNRQNDLRENRALHGLTRSLIQNMVDGVCKPFERRLTIVGVGYNASLAGSKLSLQVGFANTIQLDVPAGVTCDVPAPTSVIVRSADKQAVGQFAANIRGVRPPEPYKGKGIRYENEHVRRKAGKAFGSK